MNWPPNKAWTSTDLRLGYRHFVAINYGGKGKDRWVILASVLEADSRLKVSWNELNDKERWNTGWAQLPRDEANPASNLEKTLSGISNESQEYLCLHPSSDSGLFIPSHDKELRRWFIEENE